MSLDYKVINLIDNVAALLDEDYIRILFIEKVSFSKDGFELVKARNILRSKPNGVYHKILLMKLDYLIENFTNRLITTEINQYKGYHKTIEEARKHASERSKALFKSYKPLERENSVAFKREENALSIISSYH